MVNGSHSKVEKIKILDQGPPLPFFMKHESNIRHFKFTEAFVMKTPLNHPHQFFFKYALGDKKVTEPHK